MVQSNLSAAVPSASPIPQYLSTVTCLLYGFSAVTGSKPLATINIAHGLYWMFQLAIHPPSGDYFPIYVEGTTIFDIVLKTINAAFLRDPEDFTRISREVENDVDKDIDNKAKDRTRTMFQTVLDALEVGFVASRGLGWNFQLRIDTPRPSRTYSRARFVLERLLEAAFDLTLVDLASTYIRHFTPLGNVPVTRLLSSEPFYVSLPRAWILYNTGRWSLSAFHNISLAVCVTSTIWTPYDCPPLFGSWKEAYTIKRFWAHTWHQMMRLTAQPPTTALARYLGLQRKGRLTYYFKIAAAFVVAYGVHAYGTLIAGGNHVDDAWRYAPQVLLFFLEDQFLLVAQTFAITGGAWARVLGYVWVFVAQGTTLTWWYDSAAKGGRFTELPAFSQYWSPSEWLLSRFM